MDEGGDRIVIKICKICGKEFDASGPAKCCSPECSKINRRNTQHNYDKSDKGRDRHRKNQRKYAKTEKGRATLERHRQSDKYKATTKEYQQTDNFNNYQKEYYQKKIDNLNKRFDGDLNVILEQCPNTWAEREAIMQVEYGKSYVEAMYKKMQVNPVCEVTGRSDDLVIHHLDSFNLYPEKGADLDNLIRVTKEVHKDFHDIYGYGSNTREQWFEFLEKNRNIYI